MKISSLSSLALAALISSGAIAEEQKAAVAAGGIDQMSLANQLASLGDQRSDPLLLIAAAKVLKSLDAEPIKATEKSLDSAEILKRAKELAKGQADINAIADDVAASQSKGTQYNYSNGYFTHTSYR